MAGLIIRKAHAADHVALEHLLAATPMGSKIRIGSGRDPDFFAGAAVQAAHIDTWAAFDSEGNARGAFSAGMRQVWVEGRWAPMRYLCDLRIHPAWQKSLLLARGFKALKEYVFQPGEWAQTLVLEENVRALATLTSGRCGLPHYHPAGRYVSRLLPMQRMKPVRGVVIRKAVRSEVEAMSVLYGAAAQRRSFSPHLDFSDLGTPFWRDFVLDDFLVAEKSGELVGMLGLWNQERFQRMLITGYPPIVTCLRPVWNQFARVKLPRPGCGVPLRKATAIACLDDDPGILRAMLSKALDGKGDDLLLMGFSEADPLNEALRGLVCRVHYGRHFLVGWEGIPPVCKEPFAFDAARI